MATAKKKRKKRGRTQLQPLAISNYPTLYVWCVCIYSLISIGLKKYLEEKPRIFYRDLRLKESYSSPKTGKSRSPLTNWFCSDESLYKKYCQIQCCWINSYVDRVVLWSSLDSCLLIPDPKRYAMYTKTAHTKCISIHKLWHSHIQKVKILHNCYSEFEVKYNKCKYSIKAMWYKLKQREDATQREWTEFTRQLWNCEMQWWIWNRLSVLVLEHTTDKLWMCQRHRRGFTRQPLTGLKVFNMTGLHRTHSDHFTDLPSPHLSLPPGMLCFVKSIKTKVIIVSSP